MTCRSVAGLAIVNSASCWSAFETAELCWSLEVFLLGHRPINQYQPRFNVVEQERFLASLDIYRLVLNKEPLFLSADLASTSPAESNTGTKPNLCLTGSGGPHLKSSVFPDRWLTIEACGSFEELPTHQSSLLFPAKHEMQLGRKGLGTGILDPETQSQSEMTTKSVPIYRVHTVKYGCSLG